MGITCGVDWAEAHHDVALSTRMARCLCVPGSTPGPRDSPSCWRDRRAWGQRRGHAGRDRNRQEPARRRVGRSRVHGISDQPAGGGPLSGTVRPGRRQSDPGDAAVLAHILRTDRHLHRRCQRSANRPARSRRWPVSTRRRSGRCTKRSAGCDRCCWSSIRKRCRHFRTSNTRLRSPYWQPRRPRQQRQLTRRE